MLWWENSKIRPNQILKGLKYLWKNVTMNPVWRKVSVSRMWHLQAISSSGWEQLLMPMALGSPCSFCPCSLPCRWGFASSSRCDIVLVLWAGVDTKAPWPVRLLEQSLLHLESHFFPANYFCSWSTNQSAQGPNRWHSPDHRQVSAQPLAPSEPASGSSSHQGFLRASLSQYLHLSDETSPAWQLRSRHLPHRHLQLGEVSPAYLSTTDLAIPLPFPWKTTGTPDNQSRSRRSPQAQHIFPVGHLGHQHRELPLLSLFLFQHGTKGRTQTL